jgi:hypothetical protein
MHLEAVAGRYARQRPCRTTWVLSQVLAAVPVAEATDEGGITGGVVNAVRGALPANNASQRGMDFLPRHAPKRSATRAPEPSRMSLARSGPLRSVALVRSNSLNVQAVLLSNFAYERRSLPSPDAESSFDDIGKTELRLLVEAIRADVSLPGFITSRGWEHAPQDEGIVSHRRSKDSRRRVPGGAVTRPPSPTPSR